MEEENKRTHFLPTVSLKSSGSSYSYSKAVQEAPYRALVGVVIDGKVPDRHPVYPRHRERNQTGLTNRWRMPQSLYSDMLGTAQALKAVNMPFDQNLVATLSCSYPSMNPMLLSCQDLGDQNERNWSLLKKPKQFKASSEDEGSESNLPAA